MNLIKLNKNSKINPYLDAVIKYNRKENSNLKWLLPDKANKLDFSTFETYYNFMERIDGTNDFINFVNENKHEKSICISDHDCDGIMACVICTVGLSEFGIDISHISTNRFTTGYGMKKEMIDIVASQGIKVIYTVDQGITCNDVIEYAHSKGMKVCVTDHHTGLSDCVADCVINPCYFKNQTQFKSISGATVIFKLIYELYKHHNMQLSMMDDLATLAGITVLSDCMPMINENRILYKCMEEYCNFQCSFEVTTYIRRVAELLSFIPFSEQRKVRENSYCDEAGNYFSQLGEGYIPVIKHFNTTSINYYFVPIINAINRVEGDVTDLIDDLINLFYKPTMTLTGTYAKINKTRQNMKTELLIEHRFDGKSVCVEAFSTGVDDYSGICGLVASDVTENEKRPALIGIIPSEPNKRIKFSGRSVSGYNLYKLLQRVKENHPELEVEFGGHAEALGASIPPENLEKFRDVLCEYYSQDAYEIVNSYFLLDNVDNWLKVINALGPFGNQFELPQFYIKTTIQYCNLENKEFNLKGCGRSPIMVFAKRDLEYIMNLATKNRNKEIECVLEPTYTDDGAIRFKLVNILNRDASIDLYIEEQKNNYLS